MTARQFRTRAVRMFRNANPGFAGDITWGYVSRPFVGKGDGLPGHRCGHFHAGGRLVVVMATPEGSMLVRAQ